MKKVTSTIRYSDDELLEFKTVIDHKLSAAKNKLTSLSNQLQDINENNKSKGLEDGNISIEREYLSRMAGREQKFIRQLENALMRIKNKNYGICSVTGQLISKRRLLLVPHTTKSIHAKLNR